MAAEEVTGVHVAVAEEVVESSSFKVDIVAEKDEEKEKEDLSKGANGRSVKEDTNGDGSCVFVNGNDAVHGDSVELDLEKNGIGGEDRGVGELEVKGEVESESDLVKDEPCIGTVDQDNELMELCHVESPIDEQKSGDLVESGPVSAINAEDGVSETSVAGPNGVSEPPEDVYDSIGVGLANGIAVHTVPEAAVIDCNAKQSDEVSSVSVSDNNGGSLSEDSSFDDNVVVSRSKENEDSEMVIVYEDSQVPVVDDGECNGDGLANDNVEETVVDAGSKENEDSEIAIADDGDCYVEDNFVDSRSKENEDSEVAVADDSDSKENEYSEVVVADDGECNGNGLANDTAEHNIVNFRSKESEDSEIIVADRKEDSEVAVADCGKSNGDDIATDNVENNVVNSRSKENEDTEMVMAVADDGDCDGDGLADDGAKETVFDGRNEQNGDDEVPTVSVFGTNGDINGGGSRNVSANDSVSEAVFINSGPEQNGVPVFVSDNSVGLPADSVEVTVLEVPQPELVESSNRVVVETDCNGPGNGDKLEQNAFSEMLETVQPDVVSGNESTEGEQNIIATDDLELSAERDKTGSGSISECGETVLINDSVEIVESGPSLIPNGHENVTVDSHHVETSEFEIEIDPVDDDTKSGWLASGLKSETKISSDSIVSEEVEVSKGFAVSIVSEEAEVSKGFAECDSIEPITVSEKLAVADFQSDAPAVVENLSPVSNRDISGNDGFVLESGVSNCDSNDTKQTCSVTKGGIQFGSVVTCQEPEVLDEVERTRPFHFLIRVPRYDDEDLKEKIRLAQIRVDEKTQSRDAIRIEIQSKRATCKEYSDNFDAAISQERAARDLHRSKRQEIESIQSVMDIEDIDAKIRNMEHMIQHETLPLKDEKQFIREIKQLKQNREKLSSNMGRQDEVQPGLDQKDQINERLKSLKKEADELKVNLLKAEAVTKAAKKKYHGETEKLNKLQSQFRAADDIRQEAYAQLQSLKKQSYEKNKYYWQYRDDLKAANALALKGDKEALQNFCINKVEKFMDLWNNNDEFRKEYLRCNIRSTLRRLRTLDGRALGPDEEPPVIPQVVNERVVKYRTVSSSTSEDQTQEKVALAQAEKANHEPEAKVVEQKNWTSKSEKPVKSVPPAIVSTTASSGDKIEEADEEKPKRTKEEEEAARKAEELRKEEEAAKLREQRRLEEIAKAKEALERKRRIAEKAQARAAVRAQKEAEQKEKEREKRAKKKEKRKVAAEAGDAGVTDESVSAPTSETSAETPIESENKEKPVATAGKRPQKPSSQFTKQTKAKSIPPPLRNRGKRRMQPWLWWLLLTSLVILALFWIGNYNFSFNIGRQWFNF